MSFRDFIDRITGQRLRRHYRTDHPRSRSEPTIQLPRPQDASHETPAAPSRSITSPKHHGPSPRRHSRSTDPVGAAAGLDPQAADPPDAATQYYQTDTFKNDEVRGVLVAIDGELKGETFRILDGENKLGRTEASDVVLSSKWISREHAMIVHQEGVFAIVPLSEKNRTYVNDREVDGAELSDGDTIRLGHTTFRFRSIEGA